VAVPLAGPVTLPEIDDAAVVKLLPDLPRRRPDLIALQAGYAAEDLRYRAAIRAQFPVLDIAFHRARDATDVNTVGLGVTVILPLFNGNRGAIAIEQATRQQLYVEYEQGLNAANSGIDRILAEQRINRRQLRDIDAALVELTRAAALSDAAFRERAINTLAYTSLQASLLAKRIERVNLTLMILQQRVALQTLIGGELPVRFTRE
jgi:outer membrane protein TolC